MKQDFKSRRGIKAHSIEPLLEMSAAPFILGIMSVFLYGRNQFRY
jgi:hypothetical protein